MNEIADLERYLPILYVVAVAAVVVIVCLWVLQRPIGK